MGDSVTNGAAPATTDEQSDRAIVVSSQSNNGLTLKQIVELLKDDQGLSVEYGRLRGFADLDEVRRYVGAYDAPGVKGVRYPRAAVAKFASIIKAQDQGLITPKTVKVWMERLSETPVAAALLRAENGALIPQGGAAEATIVELQRWHNGLSELLERLVATQEERPAPPVEDRLIDAEEAASLLACSPRSVTRYVPAVRRGVFRRSDVLRYIAGLTPVAKRNG
jgi:hypothetical protein